MMIRFPIGQRSNPNRTVKGLGLTASLMLFLSFPGSSQTWDQEHTFRVFKENGVTIAETGGGPRYSGEIFRYERLVTLHEDESRPGSLMGRPFVYNLMGEDGSVFITDSQFNRVLRFDATGEYLHDIGGQGRGPGEYLVPRPLSAEDGIVTIYDRQMNRTSFYRYDGTFLESITTFRRRSLDIDAIHRGPSSEQIFLESRTSFEGRRAYVYFTSTATIYSAGQDTIAALMSGPVKGYYQIDGLICWRLFSGYPSARYHADFGIIMTTGEQPVFKYYDLEGNLYRIIRLDLPAERVTNQERREWAAAERRMIEQEPPESLSRERERLRRVEFNDPKGFWTDVTVDEDGYIWAERPGNTFRTFTRYSRSYEHLVFNPEGEFLGITNLPGASAISRGHLITRQDNEETAGIEMVIYRIVPAVPGLEYP